MKKTIRIISLGLALCLFALSLCGCDLLKPRSDEQKIRDRVDAFVTALNAGDAEEVLECLDSKSRNTFNAVFNIGGSILGGLTGFDIDWKDVFALAMGFASEDLFSMEIQDIQMKSDKTATVTLTATVQINGEEGSETGTLEMVKEKNDWFIYIQADWSSLF